MLTLNSSLACSATNSLKSYADIHSKLPEFRLQLKYLKLGHWVGTVQLLWPFFFFALYVLQEFINLNNLDCL